MSEEISTPATSVSDKERRINLINRRSTAYLLEITAVQLTIVPLFAAIFVHVTQDPNASGWLINLLIWIPYLLIRDILGVCSWGKRVVGLKLESNSDDELTTGRLVLRNVSLCIPFVPLVEFFKAYKGKDPKMTRFGDEWAQTRVVPVDPASVKGQYAGQLLGALILFYIANTAAAYLAMEYFFILA